MTKNKVANLIRQYYIENKTQDEIASLLNTAGSKTPRGKSWDRGNVANFAAYRRIFKYKANKKRKTATSLLPTAFHGPKTITTKLNLTEITEIVTSNLPDELKLRMITTLSK